MQIRKNGAIIYNSIDNTGSTDDAALGARYAKGRIDTLEGEFDNYFDKDEVLDLLEQKSAAQFVNQLPATLADNTWYYSKKYADGTDVPNDKRALYAKDSLGVTQYLGVVGDVDLTDYQEKQDNTLTTTAKTVVGGINENKAAIDVLVNKAPLEGNYDLVTSSEPLQADSCRFNFFKKQDTFTRIAERRLFNAYGPDPLAGGSVFGICEVKQMVRSDGTLYIEQTLTQLQGSSGSDAAFNKVKRFYRRGIATGVSDPFTQAATATVTWTSWKPVDYPQFAISGTDCSISVKGGFCYVAILGNFSPSGSGEIRSLLTLPAAVRPAIEVHGQIQNSYGQPSGATQTIWVGTNGVINCWGTGYAWENIRGNLQYPLGY